MQNLGVFAAWLATFAVIVVTLLVLRFTANRQAQARDTAYQAYCATHGYQYVVARPGEETRYADLLPIFKQGFNRLWNCEISGTVNGRPFTAVEFTYLTGGRYRTLHPFALMRWERAGGQLPSFYLFPVDEFSRSAGEESGARVEFPDDPIFTFAYALLADPATAPAFFTPERRAALKPLLEADPQQTIRGRGPTLFWYLTGHLPGPDVMDAFIAAGDKVAAVLLNEN
jgi:hypothetical protein